MKLNFPKDFLWGTASSAAQSEGARDSRGEITWDRFHKEDPIRFFNEVGPETTSNFYNRYKEDIDIMSDLNLNSFRTSISWARLFPEKGKVSDEAVEFYNNMINYQIEKGIEPFICLFHFDTPMRLQEIGGWESRETVEEFKVYAKTCFELFGDRVKNWFTFNEPILMGEGGYLDTRHYPGTIDFQKAIQVTHNVIVAHGKAVEAYREVGQDGKIGIILNLSPVYPRSNIKEDVEAAEICDLFFNKSFLDPVLKGEYNEKFVEFLKKYDKMPKFYDGDKEVIKNNILDILGVNFYYPRRVKVKEHAINPKAPFTITNFYDVEKDRKGTKMNPYRGWEIYEKSIYDIGINLKENYGNVPWFVSENGMGVENEDRFRDEKGQIIDDYRIEFIKSHLKYLHKVMEEGSNCKGYHLWTFCDNWSWINAYKNRYGYVEVDLEDGLKRKVKKSGEWIKKVIEDGYVEV